MSRMETFYNQFDSKKQTNVRVKNNLTVYMYMHIKCLQEKKIKLKYLDIKHIDLFKLTSSFLRFETP